MKRPAARYGFNPFPEPKKGVNRMINKRPACMKSLSWHNIPYVKEKNKGGFVRMETDQMEAQYQGTLERQ